MPVNTLNPTMRHITESAINSCIRSDDLDWNFVVLEQNKENKPFKHATTIYYELPFNYNMCMNIGILHSSAPYVAMCNNDLVFYKGWATNIIKALKTFHSASPTTKYFDGIRLGYRIEKEILGWCIVMRREVFDIIGYLDTPCTFWYSDNVYAHQLKRAGLKHVLVGNSLVRHLGSVTLNKMNYSTRKYYMKKQFELFNNYKKQNHVSTSIEK